MSIDEFIDKLAKTRGNKEWILDENYMIRTAVTKECPITSFHSRSDGSYDTVGRLLGLDPTDIELIADAADLAWNAGPLLRRKLLIATGLETESLGKL